MNRPGTTKRLATLRSLTDEREKRASAERQPPVAVDLPQPSRIFVGRTRELEVLRTALAGAASGDGRFISVAGEPGIGKTRLVLEFARSAEEQGCRVLVGACYEATLARAYGPFSTALDDYVRETDTARLRAELGHGAAAIAEILPVVRHRLPDLPALEPLNPDEARIRLYEAAAQLFVALSHRSPVLLVIDDLHWASSDAIAMLRHLAHFVARHRLLLVCTYREEDLSENHPLEDLLAVLRRETNYERLPLTGLTEDETAELARQIVEEWVLRTDPEAPPTSLPSGDGFAAWQKKLELLHLETAGNPFFVRELVLENLQSGALGLGEQPEPRWEGLVTTGVPRGVRRVVEHRLRRLSRDTKRMLTAGAGFDGPFRFDAVTRVAGLEDEAALRALDEALDSHVLRPAPGEDYYDFTHALVRRAAISHLSPSRRARLHRRIAEAIEDLDPTRHREIAYHFHRSVTLPGAERGVPHALAVAMRAEQRAAFGKVATALRIALDLLPATDPQRDELLGRLGLALAWTLEFEEAMRAIEEASRGFAARKDPDAAADYLADAARVLTFAGYQRGGWTCAELGLQYMTPTRRDRTWLWLSRFDRVRRRARDPEDPSGRAEAAEILSVGRIARTMTLTPMERTFLSPYLLPLTRQQAMDEKLTDVWVLPCYDDQRFALQVLEEGVTESESKGRVSMMVMYLAWLARARNAIGEFTAAREAIDRAKELSDRLIYPSIQKANLLGAESDLLFALDEGLGEMSTRVDQTVLGQGPIEYNWALAPIRAGMARAFAHLGQVEKALSILPHLRTAFDLALGWATGSIRTVCDAAATLWLLGSVEGIDLIESSLREHILPTDLRDYLREPRLSLAQVCALRGRFDEAQEWFEEARGVLDRQGARTLRAIVDYDEALMFGRRAAQDDVKRARELGQKAVRQFETLEMTGWIRRGRNLVDQLGAPAVGPATRLGGVSSTAPFEASLDGEAALRWEGDYWTAVYEGKEVRLRDLRGLHYLACLLRSPGRELHVTDLVRLTEASPDPRRRAPIDRSDACVRADLGDAGPSIDARAAAEYYRRLEDLRSELSEAEGCNDIGRAARSREEIAFLVDELKAPRGRKVASHAERARVTVSKGLATALRHIRRAAPELAEHLDATVHSGYFCIYKPDPRRLVAWQC